MRRKLRFEHLERRALLAATSWIGTSSANWNTLSDWSNGLPNSTTDVTIAPASAETITVPAGTTAAAQSLVIGSNATVVLSSVNAADPTTNLLGNAGFESPTASNSTTRPSTWYYWGSSYLSTQYAYAGAQSLAVSGASSGVGQSFSVTPGNSYTASVYAMMTSANPLTGDIYAEFQVLFYDSTQQNAQTLISSYSPPNQIVVLDNSSSAGGSLTGSVGDSGWNQYYTTAVAPSNAASVEVLLVTYDGNSSPSGTVYFDGAAFGPSPAAAPTLTSGNISNSGSLVIGSPASATVNGTYTQTSTGTLDIQLGGAPSTGLNGTMTVSGPASLAGTLEAQVVNGYTPATADSFTPVTYPSVTGNFTNYSMPSGTGYQFSGVATFTNVLVSSAPSTTVTTTVNTTTTLHSVSPNLLGINSTYWDTNTTTSQTQSLTTAAGLSLYRFPGGASSDQYHFNISNNFGDGVAATVPQFAQFIASAGGSGIVTVDYGSGSPQEAAAELAYLQGSPSDTTVIGTGLEWFYGASGWTSVNWQTVGYWASLRAASPLKVDDGLNFMRIGRTAPFATIKYWEIGNEEYEGGVNGEVDHHGTAGPGGVSTGTAHDPTTYVNFCKTFAALANEITTFASLPAVSIGIDSADPTGDSDNNWTKTLLTIGYNNGVNSFIPGFISDHSYMQGPGSESDSLLLNDTVTNSASTLDWSTRYADYESLLSQTLYSNAASVSLMATEYNSVYTDPGKQSTSLVNGLFIANSVGSLLESGYVGATNWDLRNSFLTGNNNSNALYGWRPGGDYGILSTATPNYPSPITGSYIAYPDYFALQLASKVIQTGGEVVSASSNYSDLDVYSVLESNGSLALLIVNTNPVASISDSITVNGFTPVDSIQAWQYGKTQDTAQSQSSTGAASLAFTSPTVTVTGGNAFGYTFPAYSMTVLVLEKTPSLLSPAIAMPTSSGKTLALSVSGGSVYGSSTLKYTWTSTPSSGVSFSASGTNAAANTTATFTAAGTYTLLVTITDSANITTTSSVAVTVSSGLLGITVSLNGVSPTETGITFNNSNFGYTIAQGTGGAIYLSNGSASATISNSSGSNMIGAPIVMESNTTIEAASGDTLTISGSISSSNGNAVAVNGAGKVILSGSNSYTGGTTVTNGTLVLDGAQTIQAGTSLVIGNSQSLGAVFAMPANAASVVSTQTDIASVLPVLSEPAKQHTAVLPAKPANHQQLGKSIGIAPVFKPGRQLTIGSAVGAAMSKEALKALAKYYLASRE